MNEIKVFENQEFGQIRMLEDNGKVLFSGTEVARALGYSNPRDAILRHCKSDGVVKRDGVVKTTNQHGVTTEQVVQMSFITEGNVYRLIVRSKLPSAERFETWVFDEVLPSLRKTGSYALDQVSIINAVEQEGMLDKEVKAKFSIAVRAYRERASEILFSQARDDWDKERFGNAMKKLWGDDRDGFDIAMLHYDRYKEMVDAAFLAWEHPKESLTVKSILNLPKQSKSDPIYDAAMLNLRKRRYSREEYDIELRKIFGNDSKIIEREMKLYDAVMSHRGGLRS